MPAFRLNQNNHFDYCSLKVSFFLNFFPFQKDTLRGGRGGADVLVLSCSWNDDDGGDKEEEEEEG